MGKFLEARLKAEFGSHPLSDIRGRGLFWTIELMFDRMTKTSFSVDDDFSGRLVEEALNQGVNVLRNMGFPGMWKMDSVVVCPPFIVTEEDIGEIIDRLKVALDIVAAPYLKSRVPINAMDDKVSLSASVVVKEILQG